MLNYFFDFFSKCHDFYQKFLTPYQYIHITSHFAFFHTLLVFFNQSPQLLSIYNPALCIFALCGISLPPIYRKVRGLWYLIFILVAALVLLPMLSSIFQLRDTVLLLVSISKFLNLVNCPLIYSTPETSLQVLVT